MNVYKSIRAWRKGEGLEQIPAAEKLGITQASLSRIERKLFKPSPALALRIEKVTGIPKEVMRPDIFQTVS